MKAICYKIAIWILSLQSIVKPCPCIDDEDSKKDYSRIKFVKTERIPKCVNESSGLIILNDTLITHNDSGGLPFLYRFSPNGQLYDSLSVPCAQNVDWEDLTANDDGVIFIGDFGNNLNNRHDLCIYTFRNKAECSKIPFTYQKQTAFPPQKRKDKLFDSEAMVFLNNKIVLFSKHKTSNIETVYLVDLKSKTNVLMPWFQFKLREKITSATVIDGNKIALLSYGKIIICSLPDQNDSHPQIKINFCKRIPFARQCEAIAYSNNLLYVTNEQGQLFLYKMISK